MPIEPHHQQQHRSEPHHQHTSGPARGLVALLTTALVVTMSWAAAPAASAEPAPAASAAPAATASAPEIAAQATARAASPASATQPASTSVGAASALTATPAARLTKLVTKAREMTTMNIPYSYGGHGPNPAPIGASVDCSGLVRQLYHYAFGVDIGRGTADSIVRRSGHFTRTSSPVPGDVILIGHGGSAPAFHAMVYVGHEDGQPVAVASPDFGEVVEYQYPSIPYWAGNVMGYWHFNGATKADSGPLRVAVDVTTRDQDGTLVTLRGTARDPLAPAASITVALHLNGTVKKSQRTADGRFTIAFRDDDGGRDARIVAHPHPGSGSAKSTVGSCAPFPDVQASNPHCWNITWLADRGITKPLSGHYGPGSAVTRGAMAAFLYRIVHPDGPSPRCTARPFPDVPVSNTFCGYISWAKKHGVAAGYADGVYRPDSPVTRGAMAAFLHRIATGRAAPACHGKPYSDVSTGSVFCGVIAWAKKHGVTYGVGNGRYGTTEPVSRQSMASFLHRIDAHV